MATSAGNAGNDSVVDSLEAHCFRPFRTAGSNGLDSLAATSKDQFLTGGNRPP